ncbi:MAG: hypothetical protein KDC80_18755 [Saprospiraceae bacterium]|nr:hypothetical protein [Saprospiraceae bacterium]
MVFRFLCFLAFVLPVNLAVFSQSYFTSMGLRMGSDFGITLQQKIVGHLTAEGIVSSSPVTRQTTGSLLVEMHNPLISKRFNFYLGGGLHNRWLQDPEGQKLVRRGVTAIAGAEMTLGRINLSWDYKPVFHLNADTQPFESETAVSLRYVFVKKIRKSRNKDSFLKQTPKEKREKKRAKKNRAKEKLKKKKERERSGRSNIFHRIFKK